MTSFAEKALVSWPEAVLVGICAAVLLAWVVYVLFFECPDCPSNDWTDGRGYP